MSSRPDQGKQRHESRVQFQGEGEISELALDELACVGGGEISLDYSRVQYKYTQQNS